MCVASEFLCSFSTSIKNEFVSEILISSRTGNCMWLNEIGDDNNKYNFFLLMTFKLWEWGMNDNDNKKFVGSWIKKLSKAHLRLTYF